MANNKSIQILRGERSKIAGKTDSLLDGQLLYNKTDNYLTAGNGDNAKISDKPVACREVHGYFGDNAAITGDGKPSYDYEVNVKTETSTNSQGTQTTNTLVISSAENIELKPGTNGTLTAKTPAYGTEETPTRDTQVATTNWVHYAQGNTALNAASATKLKTARTIKAWLGGSGSPSYAVKDFDGDSDVSINVEGVLPIANGGTGQNSLASVTVGSASNVSCVDTSNDIINQTVYRIPLYQFQTNYGGLSRNNSFVLDKGTLKTPGAIEASGSIQATSFNATSDRRKKENIKKAHFDATDFVNHLRVVNFNYIGNEEKNIGLIAQEVDELDCGVALTATGSDGFEVLKETKLIYVLIKALQEANERIDELEKQIKKEG